MSDPKQARVLLEAAERDVSALRGMGDVAVFAAGRQGCDVRQCVTTRDRQDYRPAHRKLIGMRNLCRAPEHG